jgi:hypothetical protein
MDDTPQKQRRQRAILSCNDCRRRKLKCDRLSPCNRCIKGGITDSCAYSSEAHSIPPDELNGHAVKRQRREQSRTCSSSVDGQDVSAYASHLRTQTGAGARLKLPEQQDNQVQQFAPNEVIGVKDQVEFLADSPELKGVNCPMSATGMIKGHSFGTHYYGPSSTISTVAHVRIVPVPHNRQDVSSTVKF